MATVALPIETKVRELHGKLWLGVNLVEEGHEVIIGPSYEIKSTLDITEPDIYIAKDDNVDLCKKLQKNGVKFCSIPTEGQWAGGTLEQFVYGTRDSIRNVDAYFVWGKEYKKVLIDEYGELSSVYVTGNPRFDLLTSDLREFYTQKSSKLCEDYGEYVLVNTSFAYANPFNVKLDKESRDDRLVSGMNKERLTTESRIYHQFIDLIHYLGKRVDKTIVVRPHPGENHSNYVKEFEHSENIIIKHHGDVREWIHAAQTVIHYNCTTGIEAALMDTPVISYDPIDNPAYTGLNIPQKVSKTAHEPVEVYNHIQSAGNHQEISDEGQHYLDRFMKNLDGKAAKRICEVVSELKLKKSVNIKPQNIKNRILRKLRQKPIYTALSKSHEKYLQIMGREIDIKRKQKASQKFPGLSNDEIEDIIYNLPDIQSDSYKITSVECSAHSYYLNKDTT